MNVLTLILAANAVGFFMLLIMPPISGRRDHRSLRSEPWLRRALKLITHDRRVL